MHGYAVFRLKCIDYYSYQGLMIREKFAVYATKYELTIVYYLLIYYKTIEGK